MLHNLKSSKFFCGVCPITGLTIELNVPAIPGKVLTYTNPLARMDNALSIAKLSYQEKTKIQKDILSGALLTLFTSHKLIKDKLSSVERNQLLSTCSSYTLHRAHNLFIGIPKIMNYPQIALAVDVPNSTTDDIINSYILACTGKSTEEESSHSISYTITKKETKKIKNVSPETRQKLKTLLQQITEESLLNSKVLNILTLITQKNNLYTLSSTIRIKLLAKLEEHKDISCFQEFHTILKNAAFVEEEEDIAQAKLDSRPARSLKEILEAKLHKPTIEEQQAEEELELLSLPFQHKNCTDCPYSLEECKEENACFILEEEKEARFNATKSMIQSIKLELEQQEEQEEQEEGEDDDEF